MGKLTNYLIYRHGSNAANQSMTPKAAVLIVEARSQKEACAKAADIVTVYNNQHLEAVPASRAKESDWIEASMRSEVD